MAVSKISLTELSGTASPQKAAADYTSTVSSAAQKAAKTLKTAAGRTNAGYEALKQQTARDYEDLSTRRSSLAAANGEQGKLGSGQVSTGTIRQQNALGTLDAEQAAAAAAMNEAADSLTSQAQRRAGSAQAQQEALSQELTAREGQRSGEAARSEYEQQQALEKSQTDAEQAQSDARTAYLQQLGLICLQLGYVPGDEMLEALGIDAATAKSFARYYWTYGY